MQYLSVDVVIGFIFGLLLTLLIISNRTRNVKEQLTLKLTESQTDLKIKNEMINKLEVEINKASQIVVVHSPSCGKGARGSPARRSAMARSR